MPIDRTSLRSYEPPAKYKKIPTALREQVWINRCGRVFDSECNIKWCCNTINVYNYHVGHDIPMSKGGTLDMNNLYAVCDRCNYSMSNKYTISQWNRLILKD